MSGILGKEKMQAVMWDIIGANSFTEQFIKRDSLKNAVVENMKMQQKIFSMHNITKEDFYKSYNYYCSQPDLMRTLLDSIVARGERDRIKMIEIHSGGIKK
jgi:hypothetical protein